MHRPALDPKQLSLEAQDFLFACAFWLMAADTRLTGAEQDWLAAQFGEQDATTGLERLLALDPDEFLPYFNETLAALTAADRQSVFPGLRPWLCACVTSDGELAAEENEVLQEILEIVEPEKQLEHLGLDAPAPGPGGEEPEGAIVPPESSLDETILMDVKEPGPQAAAQPAPESRSEGELIELEGHTGEVTAAACSPDGGIAATGSQDETVRLWDVAEAAETAVLEGHDKAVTALRYMPGGMLLSADRAGTVICWNPKNAEPKWEAKFAALGSISGLDAASDGSRVVLCAPSGRLLVVDPKTGKEIAILRKRGWNAFRAVVCRPESPIVAAAGDGATVHLVNTKSGEERGLLQGHESSVMSLAFSRDGRYLVSGSRDNTVRIWDVEKQKQAALLEGHSFSVYGVDADASFEHVISASWDHTVRLWSASSGELLLKCESTSGRFNAAAFLPDGTGAILAASDKMGYLLRL